MKKLISFLLGFKFREYPLWWEIMSMAATALIIFYTFYINLYSHFYWLVLPAQYWIYFGYKTSIEDKDQS